MLQVDSDVATRFLAEAHRVAVVGASDNPKGFGGAVYRELRDHGHEVVAVHPTATTVAGDPAYPDLAAVPGDLDGVVVMVPSDRAADVVRACVGRGVPRVWLFKGAGAGSVSDEAVAQCREHGIDVVPGACPLMFLEPVGLVHRIHRGMRRLRGSLTKAA